jgi:hypothetical protein
MANWTATQPASNGPGDREPQGGEAVSEGNGGRWVVVTGGPGMSKSAILAA